VLVVGNPANTNAYIAMKSAPDLPRKNFTAMLRLDITVLEPDRRQDQQAVADIEKLVVWGNHSPTMYADYRFATINGASVKDMINDQDWNATPSCLQSASVVQPSLLRAVCLQRRRLPTQRLITCMIGRWHQRQVGHHGIPSMASTASQRHMFGFAVTCEGGEYKVVQDLPIDAFSQECINKTLKELQEEQAGVAHLL